MLKDYQSVDSLIEGIKGTTGVLSSLVSRKAGLVVLLFIIFSMLMSKLLLG